MENIILVDTSFTCFYRFFAAKRWYSMAHKEEYKEIEDITKYNWSKDEIFMEMYERMFLEAIKKIVKKKVFDNALIIFCRDPPQEEIWRNNEMCEYKGGRQDLTKTNNFKPVFKYTYNKLLPKLEKENDNILVVKEDEIEADDVIALITRYLNTVSNKNIYVVSGDEDFLQLGDDNIYFVNYRKKQPFQLTKHEAEMALMKKIVEGDCSDNIEGIFKGKRIKGKKKMLEDKELLMEFLNKEENREYKIKYDRNERIIDFNNIPKKYVTSFNRKIKKLLKDLI